ncbi:histidine phosphatase family protein [Nonomuraea roseoviolacea]|uniref:Alpha-ribazole phosphatase/probable phosphoglycerate mutase n=1 Tax=Nonomuraea roseoviolacea subsp. carminata TaxID=160689 RepID=A0ABT1KEM8_9ACTN|nr:histidine phosphatase family protein [Nonomuraea roseoviolacea]MCP2351816.1 alpha-ribazole phosphatase/probable phosphoglycerate mutase [Nonomuraea roseoviolacea subsp. carminata]
MSDRVRLLCLRHGESENVTAGAAGALPLATLTARGRLQAAEAARLMSGEGATRIYASTAVRARQTADIMARALGVEVVPLEDLAEVHVGRAEGAVDPATRARAAAVLRSWIVDGDLGEAVADGEDGHAVTARIVGALTSIAAGHAGGTVAVVGHVASLTTGLSALCGPGLKAWGAPLPHAVPFPVEYDGRSWRCPSWPSPTAAHEVTGAAGS